MVDKMEIKKLTEYRRQINSNIVESMKESVTKLNEAMAMVADLQSINEVLVTALAEADQENKSQAKDIINFRQKIDSMNKVVVHAEEKEKQYAEMDLSMAKVSALLACLEDREKRLSVAEKELALDRQAFDKEKNSIISAKSEADEKARKYLTERNDAIKSRDAAVADCDKAVEDKKKTEEERNKAEEEKIKAEKELAELREELAEYSNASVQDEERLNDTIKSLEWYRNYAIAVDRKIIDYFRNKNDDLDGHYYTFLNNPDKLEEIHAHFPDYVIEGEPDKSGKFESIANGEESNEDVSNKDEDSAGQKETDDKVKKEKKDKKSDRPVLAR